LGLFGNCQYDFDSVPNPARRCSTLSRFPRSADHLRRIAFALQLCSDILAQHFNGRTRRIPQGQGDARVRTLIALTASIFGITLNLTKELSVRCLRSIRPHCTLSFSMPIR
jgi:hypothetical protein